MSVRSDTQLTSADIDALSALDDEALRRRWRRLIGQPLSGALGRALTLHILAYYQQAQKSGDLDRMSLQILADSKDGAGQGSGSSIVDENTRSDGTSTRTVSRIIIQPGTMLMREHDGVPHRVMALEKGFTWNGKTYASLSQVAFAITGTRWNGHRFFGLRDKRVFNIQGEPANSAAAHKKPGASTVTGKSSSASKAKRLSQSFVTPKMPERLLP